MNEDKLIANYPRLFHMAHAGAWPAIRDRGLMSASALLDDYSVQGDERFQLEKQRRPKSVPLDLKDRPGAVIRDQKPMTDSALEECLLDELTPSDWYQILNSKSFFWLSKERVWRLLKARAYRDLPQTVLTVDTRSLIEAHRGKIWLSPINSGATLFKPQPRGKGTFMRIADFPFEVRAKTRAPQNNVVELLVEYSVPDIASHVLAVHEVMNDKIQREIWRADNSTFEDKP